jgi:hypothetical protein
MVLYCHVALRKQKSLAFSLLFNNVLSPETHTHINHIFVVIRVRITALD